MTDEEAVGGFGDIEYFTDDTEEEFSFWKRKRRQKRRQQDRNHREVRHAIINT